MIFRNSIRLLLTNFSTIWKVIVYYIICFVLTAGVCYWLASPVIAKLAEANVFQEFVDIISNFFSNNPTTTAYTIEGTFYKSVEVLQTNIQFTPNYVTLIVWLALVFPYMLSLSQLAMGDVLYGFMTSQVKYGFTGRMIKNLGKSALFSLVKIIVQILLNVIEFLLLFSIVKLLVIGGILNIFFAVALVAFVFMFIAFKRTLIACWLPTIAVLDFNPLKALKFNFKVVFRNFFNIYSNFLYLGILAVVINLIFGVFTATVSLIITLPLTAFTYICFQMVSFFSTQGMRFYVYPDMFISPKHFEEQDNIKRVKNLL